MIDTRFSFGLEATHFLSSGEDIHKAGLAGYFLVLTLVTERLISAGRI